MLTPRGFLRRHIFQILPLLLLLGPGRPLATTLATYADALPGRAHGPLPGGLFGQKRSPAKQSLDFFSAQIILSAFSTLSSRGLFALKRSFRCPSIHLFAFTYPQ